MSIRIQQFGKTEGVTFLEFGKGTIRIVNAKSDKGKKFLLFSEIAPTPIGQDLPFVKDADDFEPEVVIEFGNKESFEVFAHFVDLIRKEYNEQG